MRSASFSSTATSQPQNLCVHWLSDVLGGYLLGLGWRLIFLVNLPVGLLAIWATRRLVRESRAPGVVGVKLET